MSEPPRSRRLRVQFSLKSLLALTTLVAVSVVAWQFVFYVHPAHRVSAYGMAPYTLGRSIRVGPNLVGMKRLTRNDRDGSLISTDGRETLIKNAAPQNAQELTSCAPWLDVVQLELDVPAEQLEVLEIRIFDHRTRTIISENEPRFGWRAVSRNTIQIYGIGEEIPEQLDIWLRLYSYSSSDSTVNLLPIAGAECELPNGSLNVYQVRDGSWGGSSPDYDYPLNKEGCTFLLKGHGISGSNRTNYHVCAVLSSGERLAQDRSIDFFEPVVDVDRLHFHCDRTEIERFEIRATDRPHSFFYEAVSLPKLSGKPFQKPPAATFQVQGQEIYHDFAELAPLKFSAETRCGDWGGKLYGGLTAAVLIPPDEVKYVDKMHTLIYRATGFALTPAVSSFFAHTNQPVFSSGRGHAGCVNKSLWYEVRDLPLSELRSVDFQFPPPAARQLPRTSPR